MQPFVYLKTVKTIYGKGKLLDLPKEISMIGKRPLVVYGKNSLSRSGKLNKIKLLLNKFSLFEYNGISGEPTIEMVNEAYQIGRAKKVDCILAVGGGSVIDCAKAISLSLGNKILPKKVFNLKKIKSALPLITIPTLPGSSSEVNGSGIIFLNGKKEEVNGVFPKVCILDPSFFWPVSKSFIFAGISDAVVHVAEHYFNSKYFSNLLSCWAEGIFVGLLSVAEKFKKNSKDMNIAGEVLVATSLSPKLSPVSGNGEAVWEIHPLAHMLAEFYDLSHRIIIGICFNSWLVAKKNSKNKAFKFNRFKQNVLNKSKSFDLPSWHSSWLHNKGLPATLGELNLNDDKQKSKFIKALKKRQKCFSKQELERFIKAIYSNG